MDSYPYQILVFDIANNKLLKRNYKEDYRFNFEKVSNGNLIYSYTADAEDSFEYDTFNISDMELISPNTQVSPRY